MDDANHLGPNHLGPNRLGPGRLGINPPGADRAGAGIFWPVLRAALVLVGGVVAVAAVAMVLVPPGMPLLGTGLLGKALSGGATSRATSARPASARATSARATSARAAPRDTPRAASGDELVFEAGPAGHVVLEARVNGRPVRFLVDTGASRVVLSRADGERVGLRPGPGAYTQRYRTANGLIAGAPVVLDEVRIGRLRLEDVAASIIDTPLPVSLLGMSFLSRLDGYEMRGGRLILRW